MACLPCIILRPHMVVVVAAQIQLEAQMMGVEEAKTPQSLGQVVMARGPQPVGMEMVMERTASELALMDDCIWKHVSVDSRCFPKVAAVLGDA